MPRAAAKGLAALPTLPFHSRNSNSELQLKNSETRRKSLGQIMHLHIFDSLSIENCTFLTAFWRHYAHFCPLNQQPVMTPTQFVTQCVTNWKRISSTPIFTPLFMNLTPFLITKDTAIRGRIFSRVERAETCRMAANRFCF